MKRLLLIASLALFSISLYAGADEMVKTQTIPLSTEKVMPDDDGTRCKVEILTIDGYYAVTADTCEEAESEAKKLRKMIEEL